MDGRLPFSTSWMPLESSGGTMWICSCKARVWGWLGSTAPCAAAVALHTLATSVTAGQGFNRAKTQPLPKCEIQLPKEDLMAGCRKLLEPQLKDGLRLKICAHLVLFLWDCLLLNTTTDTNHPSLLPPSEQLDTRSPCCQLWPGSAMSPQKQGLGRGSLKSRKSPGSHSETSLSPSTARWEGLWADFLLIFQMWLSKDQRPKESQQSSLD